MSRTFFDKTKIFTITLALVALFAGQVFMLQVLTQPQPVQAAGLGSIVGGVKAALSVPEWNWYEVLKDIALGAAEAATYKVTEHFLNDFISKINEKYKIRNFLYYDQVLSDYYINRFIADKIQDPNLKQIYGLLEAGYISGAPTGTTGGPDPRQAVLPQLKTLISNYYTQHEGGTDPNLVYNPDPDMSDQDYFAAARAYFSDPPSYTEQNLYGQYGAFQSAATTASQLEVATGNGLKAGRYIGGTCSATEVKDPTPDSCQAAGGKWDAAVLDDARSFIDNPAQYVTSNLTAALSAEMQTDWDPKNFWIHIGGSLANLTMSKLALDQSSGASTPLPDGGDPYVPVDPNDTGYTVSDDASTNIDLDGDDIPDGVDYNNDGTIDYCTLGGTPPDACITSTGAFGTGGDNSGNTGPAPVDALLKHPDRTQLVNDTIAQLQAAGVDLTTDPDCGKFTVVKYVAWALRDEGAGYLKKPAGNNCDGYSTDILLFDDGYAYDIVADGPKGQWNPDGCDASGICPELYQAPSDPYPSCPITDPLGDLSSLLSDISSQVSDWNPNGQRVGDIGISHDQLQQFDDDLDAVEKESAVSPYSDKIENIQKNDIGPLEGDTATILNGGGPLHDGDTLMTSDLRQLVSDAKTKFLQDLGDLMDEVSQACNAQ